MSQALAIPLFAASLAVTLAAARLFARRLDKVGERLGLSEGLVGLLTALGADGPEIASALYALASGARGVGVGVLVGSNAFNLAAMIGVSGLLAGHVRLPARALALEGGSCAAVTALGCALLAGWIAPAPAALGLAAVLAAYLAGVLLGAGRRRAPRSPQQPASQPDSASPSDPAAPASPPDPAAPACRLEALAGAPGRPVASSAPTRHLLAAILLDVALIIAGSAGLVRSALALGARWQISGALLGALALGPLTSLPNAATAIRLGLAGRGEALVGETFNSNTINLAVGGVIPSLVLAPAAASATGDAELAWLAAMTAATICALAVRRGLSRPGAAALIAAYAGFVALAIHGA